MKVTVFADLSSGDYTEMEEAVGNKDYKQLNTSKSKSTARKKRLTQKQRIRLRRKKLLSIKAYSQQI